MGKNVYIPFIRELLEEALSCINNLSNENNMEKLYSLLHNSMEYLKIASESGRNNNMQDTFMVKELINRVTELIEYQLRIRSISINFQVQETGLYVKGNYQNYTRALLYIFMEIIRLHDKYENFDTIYLSADETNNKADITVSFKLKNPTTISFAHAKSLIDQSGGTLSIKHTDNEMCLSISIPLLKGNSMKNSLKVLVVDDDPLIRELFTDFLQMLGEECIVCNSYEQALELIKTSSPDIVLVDYNMPNMNGIEFIRMASKFIDRTKLCLLTGELASTILSKFNEDERVRIIEKPVTLSKIREFLMEFRGSECSM